MERKPEFCKVCIKVGHDCEKWLSSKIERQATYQPATQVKNTRSSNTEEVRISDCAVMEECISCSQILGYSTT